MITREEARDMAEAHGEGWHDDLKREGCPECEGRELSSYPQWATEQEKREQETKDFNQQWEEWAKMHGPRSFQEPS